MSSEIDSYPVPNETIQGRLLDNEAVVVLPDKGEIKVLNEVGARIWSLADGTRSVREIAAMICSEYRISQAEAESDTLEFVSELQAKGIVSLEVR